MTISIGTTSRPRIAQGHHIRILLTILSSLIATCLLPTAEAQGSVAISNMSYPFTALEVGNTVGITITGAAANAPVTVIANGGSPFLFGYTDASGNWSVTNTIASGDTGSWTEYWYVNGVAVNPNNVDKNYAHFAPILPMFQAYPNYSGAACPGLTDGDGSNSCTVAQPTALSWAYTPVSYYNASSTVSTAVVNTAAGNWNGVNSEIALTNNSAGAIYVYDDSSTTGDGATASYGGDCTGGCLDYIDNCTGGCILAQNKYYVNLGMNGSQISAEHSVTGVSVAAITATTINHELGHALGLGHAVVTGGATGRCSEVTSVMYLASSVLNSCGVTQPNGYCDGSALNSIYSSGLPACSPVGSNACYELPAYSCS